MAAIEGIIFGDLFINNKQLFIDFFSQYYQERQQEIDPVLHELKESLHTFEGTELTPSSATRFKNAWKQFQKIVLLNNQDLELLVAFRGSKGKNAEFSTIIKQEQVEGNAETKDGNVYGIKTGDLLLDDADYMLKSQEIEAFLQHHLNNFLNQLEQTISKSTAEKIHDHHEYCLTFALQNSKENVTGKTWWQAFYMQSGGAYFGGRGLGQAYDAFMNHLANKERDIYDFLASGGIKDTSAYKMSFKNSSVYVEEGGVENPYPASSFAELLRASRNHIGWYTGGDIVIVNPKTMQVVYNIQLKTTTKKVQSVFRERVSAIRAFIDSMIDSSPEEKAKKIFEFLLTSVSNHGEFNNSPQEEVDQLLKDSLSIKAKGVNISFS